MRLNTMTSQSRSIELVFWGVLWGLQLLLAVLLVYALSNTQPDTQAKLSAAASEGTYKKLLSEGRELNPQQQHNLMNYCSGLEQMVDAHVQSNLSMLSGLRSSYFALLAFLALCSLLQAGIV